MALTSLDRVELMSALETRFQVELNETSSPRQKPLQTCSAFCNSPRPVARYVYPRWTQRASVRWLRLAVYYALVWPATQILAHPNIVGRENLRGVQGPVLVISNHITRRADIGLILAALPPRFRHFLAIAMGGESLQRMRQPPRDWFFPKRWAYQLGYGLVTLLFNVFLCRSTPVFEKSALPANPPTAATASSSSPKARSTIPKTAAWRRSRTASACWRKISVFPSFQCVLMVSGK